MLKCENCVSHSVPVGGTWSRKQEDAGVYPALYNYFEIGRGRSRTHYFITALVTNKVAKLKRVPLTN